jgi:hypothetical protein
MKIYEYYSTDINKQELFYTACRSEIESRFDRDTTGKVFEADMPEGVKIVSFDGIESLCTADGRQLYIHRRATDGAFFLIFTQSVVDYGMEWHECIYKGITAKEIC